MPAVVSRIQLKNGTVYEARKPWPGTDGEGVPETEQLKVGMITYFPAEEEITTEGEGDDEETVGSESHPARYELWAVNDRMYTAILGLLQKQDVPKEEIEYLANMKTALRRIIYADSVDLVDEEWTIDAAMKQIGQRMIDWQLEAEAEQAAAAEAAENRDDSNGSAVAAQV